MDNRLFGTIFDTGATFDALVDIYRYGLAILELVYLGRAIINAIAMSLAFIIIDFNRY
jgi:hypothetical protein